MRIDITELLRPHGREPEPQVDLPPSPLGGSRTQRLQRLQVGVFGVAAMVLLVGLANIIKTNAERTDAQAVAESVDTGGVSPEPTQASDPLAEAGVVPGMPTQNKPKDGLPAQTSSGGAPGAAPQP